MRIKEHSCLGDEWRVGEVYWVNDGRGIPLALVCDKCRKEKLSRYRSDIMDSNYETDEPIESDDW